MSRLAHTASNRWKMFKFQWKLIASIIIIALVAIIVIVAANTLLSKDDGEEDIVIEDTPLVIESVRPTGELYVSSAIMEDFVTISRTEHHLGFIPEEHTCVQIVKQKCSFKIDLDKIKYSQVDNSNVVYVTMPSVEYQCSTQDSPFMSDDENYWAEELPSTNELKREVEEKIKSKFDTPQNRNKSNRYAEAAVAELLKKLGFKAEFMSNIEQSAKD